MPEITAPPKSAASASPWTRQNPFPGKLVVNRRLSSADSQKDTRHFEIDLTGWGLNFEPGDSVAVYPTNDPNLVKEIIRALGTTGDEPVPAAKTTKPFREALLRDYSITQPTPKFLKAIADRADKVPVPVYPSSAKHFHMPEDQTLPLIMIGPGTGIAPFRAFLQERQALGAKGKNWLFFGSQREKCDYAYKEDWESFTRDGFLTRLDCAWSRDQAHKIYVQHKMLENATEIWKWIDDDGAQFFVCGDARRMAKDVDAALRKIVQEQGGKSVDEANAYVEKLKTDKRYKRDV